jgi:hypothetical protein
MKSGMLLSAAFHATLMVWALLLAHRPAPLEAHANQGPEIDIAFQTEEELNQEKEEVKEQERQETKQPKPVETSTDKSAPEKPENTQNDGGPDLQLPQPEMASKEVAPDAGQNAGSEATDRKRKETAEQTGPAATATRDISGSGNGDKPEKKNSPANNPSANKPAPGDDTGKSEIMPASRPQPAVETSGSGTIRQPDKVLRPPTHLGAAEDLAAAETGEKPDARNNSEVQVDLGERMAATMPDQPAPDRPIDRQEYDALKKQINECWEIPKLVDTENLEIVLDIQMSHNGKNVQLKKVLVNGAKSQSQMNQIVISLSRNLREGNCQLADILPDDSRGDVKLVRIIFEPRDF